ncbi:hypothetical protein Psch_02208 [Pelotomaculum schinkii]|uniref:Uncharacterized protein n=1 Tax=Pelotomaculum schinkii TaxID=78350 RepID=A0A4Y7RIV7_9FIRM|nr:hypothetical protein Psch_02208 [Pelotomaculum schinkii]
MKGSKAVIIVLSLPLGLERLELKNMILITMDYAKRCAASYLEFKRGSEHKATSLAREGLEQ